MAQTVINTLLLTDLVGSTRLVERLGDERAAEVFVRQDRLARDLLGVHHGREIDKTDGFLLLFERPIDAVLYALAYHHGLATLSEELGVPLAARAGVHLGEIVVYENTSQDVARGAKPIEVEGLAKPLAARVMSLAQGGQTLITRAAFDLARRAVVGSGQVPEGTVWVAHGPYLVKGCEEPIEVFEVGVKGVAPLSPPPDTEKARRSVAAGDEATLGWRPAAGLPIPHRSGWELEQKLAEGGFGEVWLAKHGRTKGRRVFKFCFDADRLRSLQRELTLFRLLRDALGDRKDIARLFDVQLDEAPFFLESEFTPAGSLVDWADAQGGLAHVPLELRIDLVAQTARAVQAAHSVGIVHKDIKPANILVYEDEDGIARPRLADFGIGTIMDQGQLEQHNITVAGFTPQATGDLGSRTGTRMYAPPESLTGRPFTVQGDVYALGVLLYQMVVGDLERPLAQGWEREVASRPLLREDIAVCVEGNPEQRLGSAQGLAKRLEQLPERRRQYRRRRVAQFAFGLFVGLAVLGTVAVVWGLREGTLRAEAEVQRDRAKEITHLLTEMIASPDALDAQGSDVLVIDVLDRGARQIEAKFDDQPQIKAALLQVLGRSYRKLQRFDAAQVHIAQALRLREALFTPPHEELAESLAEWAELQWDLGAYDEAEPDYRRALAMRRELAAERPDDATAQLRLADSVQHWAALTRKTKSAADAEPFFREALAIRQEYLPPDHRDLARSRMNLGFCFFKQGLYEQAEPELEAALEMFRKIHGNEPHAEIAGAMSNLGRCRAHLGRHAEARRLLEEAVEMKRLKYGRRHSSVATSLHYLGELLIEMGDETAARAALEEALEIREAVLPEGHDDTRRTAALLASLEAT